MSSLIPRPYYTEEELKELFPRALVLQQVQILMRHGERTPISARFPEILPSRWPYCRSAANFRSTILDPLTNGFTTFRWQRHLETFDPKHGGPVPVITGDHSAAAHNICDPGTLTDVGRHTTHALGERLRRLYVRDLGFLPQALGPGAGDWMYLRSTHVPRALESMQQALHGLYPPYQADGTRWWVDDADDEPPPTIVMRAPKDETLLINEGHCPRLKVLVEAFRKRAAHRWDDSPEVTYVNERLGQYMPAAKKSSSSSSATAGAVGDAGSQQCPPERRRRIQVESKPGVLGVLDTINASRAHGPEVALPPDFYDPKLIDNLEKVVIDQWFSGFANSEEYRRLGIGSLLNDMVTRIDAVVKAEDGTEKEESTGSEAGNHHLRKLPFTQKPGVKKFGLSGCHDTTLAGTLISLGVKVHEWPPFTSHIAMELFSTKDPVPEIPGRAPSPILPRLWARKDIEVVDKEPSTTGPSEQEPQKTTKQPDEDGWYVRLRYNDKPVVIPGCAQKGNHLPGKESFCTLAAFKRIVSRFTPKDWRAECSVSSDKRPAIPEKPEPAGYD